MKLILTITILLMAICQSPAPFYPNYFTTNLNPIVSGGVVSNFTGASLAFATSYTNATDYYAELRHGVTISSTSSVEGGMRSYVDFDGNGVPEASEYYSLVAATAVTKRGFICEMIPPRTKFAFTNTSVGGSTASFTAGSGQIAYFPTNSSTLPSGYNAITYGAHFVDAAVGVDSGLGTADSPWATLLYANSNALSGYSVFVLPGTYVAQITNSTVLWNFSRGVVVTNQSVAVSVGDDRYITIRGEGDIVSAANAVSIISSDSGADIQARLVKGVNAIEVSTTSGRTRLKISNAQIVGEMNLESFGDDPEILLFGVSFIGDESGVNAPFSVIGGVATNNPVSAFRTGDWVVNPNLQINPL